MGAGKQETHTEGLPLAYITAYGPGEGSGRDSGAATGPEVN